jgi:hypothetical protein
MKLSNELFKTIIKSLPSIDVELDFEGDEGFKEVEEHEIEVESFLLYVDFTVHESGLSEYGDFYTPPSYHSSGKTSFVSDITIFESATGIQIDLASEQLHTLSKEIESILEKS